MKTVILTPTPNLQYSLDFYISLGFKHFIVKEKHFVTDGKVLIEIDTSRYTRAGIRIYTRDCDLLNQRLRNFSESIEYENGYLLSDLSGIWIHLTNEELDLSLERVENSFSALGNFSGLSLESIHLSKHFQFWEALGYQITMGGTDKPWMVTEGPDKFQLSLMKTGNCPHLFFNPSLSYFNGPLNLERIKKIRALKIPITEEITHFNKEGVADNIIVRDPGGYGFFIFND